MSKEAKVAKRHRSLKQRMETIPLTPMIDVVFQLLIFFVLTFVVPDRLTEMEIKRTEGDGHKGTLSDTITIYGAENGASPYAFNDRGVTFDSLEQYVYSVADHDPTQTLIIKATVESRHKHLVALLNVISDAGIENVSLLSVK